MNSKPLIIIGILLAIIILSNTGKKESTVLLGEQVMYYNDPISITLATNLADAQITTFFNELPYPSTVILVDGQYSVIFNDLNQEGIAKVALQKETETNIILVEVKKPFVKVTHDFPMLSIEKGTTSTLKVQTYTPQGSILDAEDIEVVLYNPDNSVEIIPFNKDGNTFSKSFTFKEAGGYIFKMYGKHPGFNTQEYTAIVNVTQPEGVPYIITIWFVLAGLFILLFIVARLRGKKIGKRR